VAKFDKDGKFVKSWGQKGSGQGQFDNVRSIAVNAQGDVYVADGNNHRIQIFDNNGTFKSQIGNLGNPQAICMTSGANPMLYVSNSNPPNDIDKVAKSTSRNWMDDRRQVRPRRAQGVRHRESINCRRERSGRRDR
jgi:hypothetical protein